MNERQLKKLQAIAIGFVVTMWLMLFISLSVLLIYYKIRYENEQQKNNELKIEHHGKLKTVKKTLNRFFS